MKVLLYQLDGKIPNLALMRISAHHKRQGDEVELRRAGNLTAIERGLWDSPDRVYASLIFERSRPLAERLREIYPEAIIGGTGWDSAKTLADAGISESESLDYSIYPGWSSSIGFTQRGCRLRCKFCVVPRKEGAVREVSTIADIWRGDEWPRDLLLLDNDFFGQPSWRDRIAEIREGGFRVSFNQGINARIITKEVAQAIASVDYRDDSMRCRRLYTAWDNRKDEARLFQGLRLLAEAGIRPANIMVYMLIGYWPGETVMDWLYRESRIRDFGAMPYPMPYVRNTQAVGFQRWVVGSYARRGIAWSDWVNARYQPKNLNRHRGNLSISEAS